jgi:hypothetical protein
MNGCTTEEWLLKNGTAGHGPEKDEFVVSPETLWAKLKKSGSAHYKTGGTEPIDLYVAGGMFQDFALASIIKYAFRSRREMDLPHDLLIKNLDKIIDYAQKLKALRDGK